jgi:O-antigen/teichoic acid export membrane protein
LQSNTQQELANTLMSSHSMAATISKGAFFGVVASLAQLSTRFVTVPIVIGYLGLDGYGIWSIIMTTAGCMRFGSAGVKSAYQKYVAEATGSGDFLKASRLLSTGSAAMLVLSVVGLVPLAAFSDSLARLIGVSDHFVDGAAGSISVLALIMVLSNVGAVYEAIVMGGHRVDLTRKFMTACAILEAIAVVISLYLGFGLLAMSAIMALSEMVYLLCCYVASRRVLPAIKIASAHVSRGVLRDLFAYAGSYQVVGMLEVLYVAILPVTILKWFGADAAGVFAVVNRLVTAAVLPQEAFLFPILSGASQVHASGSVDRMLTLLTKSFKATLAGAMLPLAFIASHGPLILLAWTGQSSPDFRMAFWLICIAALFKALSLLALVLYRASGRTRMDNIRQILRILVLVLIGIFAPHMGFLGILGGLVAAELIGMVFMLFAMISTFQGLRVRMLFPDTVKLVGATIMVLAVGGVVANVSMPWEGSERLVATLKLGVLSLASLATAWLAFRFMGVLSKREIDAMLQRPPVLKMKS